jgi:hypothetical protein
MNSRSNLLRAIMLGLSLLAWRSAKAQEPHPECRAMKYEHYNQVDYTLRISSVQGNVKLPDGFPASQGCVGVFAKSGESLLQTSHLDSEGRFEISGLPNGKYRLVITVQGFCAANAVVVLKNKRAGKKQVHAVMKPRGIDDCSYIVEF